MSSHVVTHTRQIAQSPWMGKLAAIGFFVYGGVYVLLGALAAKVAIGTGGRITGSKGVILEVAREPFGNILLIVIMVGLFAYALWRLIGAIGDPEGHGTGAKGIVIRGGRLVGAILYGALAIFTYGIVTGDRSGGGDANWAMRLITEPLGAVVGTLVALIMIGAGIEQFRKAYTADFGERMRHSSMSRTERTGGHYAARIGFSARGVVFGMAGGYLLYAVIDADPKEAKSVDELLVTLLRLPYGDWIMGFVALGLACYGLFMILVAMHRRHPY